VLTGLVSSIQRFCLHDGPGIRTTLFLKGCPLRCFWCHNPECLSAQPQVQVFPERCLGCGACVAACDHGARTRGPAGPVYRRDQCQVCGHCITECFAGALEMVGRRMTVGQVMDELLRDRAFYRGLGGITLSGGEPLMQVDFSRAVLAAGRDEGLHTALETSAHCLWEDLECLLPLVDLLMVDLKHADPEKHRAVAGVTNKRILENLQRLAATDIPLLLRTPVIPTVNDTPEEVGAIADLVKGMRENRLQRGAEPPRLELLPFHRLASDKYRGLGLTNKSSSLRTPPPEALHLLVDEARKRGIEVECK
jgi:pyruvate formate lyase activating enzyme